jgi:hypothetical protein
MSQESGIGRPKRKQTWPLIFERVRSRVRRRVSMSAKPGMNIDRYIEWASAEIGADEAGASFLTIDQGLERSVRRNKQFQDSLDGKTESRKRSLDGSTSSASQPWVARKGIVGGEPTPVRGACPHNCQTAPCSP